MTDTNAMADERETAQWYICNSQSIEVQAVIETLTLSDRTSCYRCHAGRAGDDGLCYACHDAGTAFGPRI